MFTERHVAETSRPLPTVEGGRWALYSGADHVEVGDEAEGRDRLDGLVGGAVLPDRHTTTRKSDRMGMVAWGHGWMDTWIHGAWTRVHHHRRRKRKQPTVELRSEPQTAVVIGPDNTTLDCLSESQTKRTVHGFSFAMLELPLPFPSPFECSFSRCAT